MRKLFGAALIAILLIAINLVGLGTAGAVPGYVRPSHISPGSAPAGSVDLGPVPSDQVINLSVVLPPTNGSELASLLQNQHDPSSPQFHQWLRPGQFDQLFGPSPSDVAGVESWLHGVGLTQTTVSGFVVKVSATASRASTALGTPFERYKTPNGHQGYLARQAPLVPQSLASGEVSAILGLNTTTTFQPQTTLTPSVKAKSGVLQPHADGLTACPAAQAKAAPGYYTLDSLGAAYGVGSLLSDGQNGHGVTVGLYELASSSPSDTATYESCFGLTNPVSVDAVDGGGGTVGGRGTLEADVDIEQVATQAPASSIISYEGPDSGMGPYDTWNAIVQTDAAQVISTSWGSCEPLAVNAGYIPSFSTLFEEAAAQGQTVLAASADSGSEDCYSTIGSTALEVDYPASDPWVTGVGGTDLNGPGNEVTWIGSGGGVSRYFTDPTWQPVDRHWTVAGNACGLDCREVPDISANAGIGMVVYENGVWTAVGGTSLASPLVAGIVTDRNDGCATRTGDLAPALYGASAQNLYGSGLTDITSGENDYTGTYAGAYYPASTGYDPATGLGSPIATGLSCPEVRSVSAGYSGSQVTVSGLGLEHATIDFGGSLAQVLSANATSATVVVPSGIGTVSVHASSFLGAGTQTTSFTYGAPPPPPPPPPQPAPSPQHGYWLVGSDGGIFTYGSAQFYGSTGNLHLQRPVVGITPASDRGGYWLVASDGGIFSFGDSGFYGSIPGVGLHPAGSGQPNSLRAPIVAMVPSSDGGGYFMVASDGGVFAFGDAKFAGSCPGIGGCAGSAVAVMPDASGNGYWLVTSSGAVYAFGDAPYYGAPGAQGVPVTSAVRTPDGRGYWILFGNGAIASYGDAGYFGAPTGAFNGFNPASAIFATADGGGYWVASGMGGVYPYGDAPNDGSMAGTRLNGSIIAGTGW
jgi:kumamolisin